MSNINIKDFETFIKEDLNESSLMRIKSHFSNYDCGFITAFRTYKKCDEWDDGGTYTLEENLHRNRILHAKLTAGTHYGVTNVKGVYIENFNSEDLNSISESNENVFLVVDLKNRGTLLRDLIILGRSCNQDSILYVPKSLTDEINPNVNNYEDGKLNKSETFGLSKNDVGRTELKDGAFLIGTNRCPKGYPGYNNVVAYYGVDWGKLGMFHTKVKSRPFYFKNTEIFKGYENDKDGNFILDDNGNKIPMYYTDDNPVEFDLDSILNIQDSDIEMFESNGELIKSPFLIETDLTNMKLPINNFDSMGWFGKMGISYAKGGKFR